MICSPPRARATSIFSCEPSTIVAWRWNQAFRRDGRSPPVAGWLIAVPAKPGRAERSARVAASFKRIEIKRPHYGTSTKATRDDRAHGDQRRGGRSARRRAADPWVLLTTHASRTPKTLRASCAGIGRAGRSSRYSAQSRPGLRSGTQPNRDASGHGQTRHRRAHRRCPHDAIVHARSGATGQKLTDALEQAAAPLVEALTRKLEARQPGSRIRIRPTRSPAWLGRRTARRMGRLRCHGYKPAGPRRWPSVSNNSTPSEPAGKCNATTIGLRRCVTP